jgi:hypothetical protein
MCNSRSQASACRASPGAQAVNAIGHFESALNVNDFAQLLGSSIFRLEWIAAAPRYIFSI